MISNEKPEYDSKKLFESIRSVKGLMTVNSRSGKTLKNKTVIKFE